MQAAFDKNDHALTAGWATRWQTPYQHVPIRRQIICRLFGHKYPDAAPHPPNGHSLSNLTRCPRCTTLPERFSLGDERVRLPVLSRSVRPPDRGCVRVLHPCRPLAATCPLTNSPPGPPTGPRPRRSAYGGDATSPTPTERNERENDVEIDYAKAAEIRPIPSLGAIRSDLAVVSKHLAEQLDAALAVADRDNAHIALIAAVRARRRAVGA